ncbi:MAG: type IV toxin-antitoxin system AbiEi family antitoxin domain-containing protein [Thermoleophilia bacterium]
MTRREALDRLIQISADQGGYLTTAQAARLGVERTVLSDLVRGGDLRRVRRGVYAMRGTHHPHEREMAAWLSVERTLLPWEWHDGDPRAIVSHASAASFWDLGTIIPDLPSLTVRGAVPKSRLEIHTSRFDRDDWQWTHPEILLRMPVTTPARTVVDLALAGEEPDHVLRAAREAMSRGLMSDRDLRSAIIRRPRAGPRIAHLIESLDAG